nr:YwqG family protein [Saccharibacillus sp. JS10]
MNTAKQSVVFKATEPENYEKIGNSRVAGEPDLPESITWPLDAEGTPMTFVLQLDLSQVYPLDPEYRVPSTGHLFFFTGYYEMKVEHRVFYATPEEMQTASRRSAPAPTVHEEDEEPFRPYRLETHATIDLPGYGYVDEELIEGDEFGWEEYEDLNFALEQEHPSPIVKMFGYAEGQHGDDEYQAALELFGAKRTYDLDEAVQNLAKALGGDQAKAKQEIADMVMLAEIDSNQEVGFLWGDAGVLHYFIRKEDLLKGNFDRTYCTFYSS